MFQGNQDILVELKKNRESHLAMVAEFGRMGSNLADIAKLLSKTVAAYTSQNIVLQSYDMPFSANGYLYNSLIIGDSAINDNAKIVITLGGLSYTIPLLPGDNAINIPDGASFHVTTTSGNPVTAVLTRYNTPGNNDTNVSIQGSASVNSNVTGSTIRQPVDVQSHFLSTIQTHNAVSIALSASSLETSFIDTDGFTAFGVTLLNDAATSASIDLYWSNDGSSIHGIDYAVVSNTNRYKTWWQNTKARYVKVNLNNLDATLAHTMSAWAYLQA